MSEVWKDINGWEGFYQISSKGNVISLPRTLVLRNGKKFRCQGKRLNPQPNSSGYLRVKLTKPGKRDVRFVHRLVAEHFVHNPAPEEYAVVNHIDNNFRNNNYSNLEWTTPLGNVQHAKNQGRLVRTKEWLSNQRKALSKYDKAVVGYDAITGKTYVEFRSIQEAGRNGYDASCVCDCCKGKRKTHKGLAWEYKKGVILSGEKYIAE